MLYNGLYVYCDKTIKQNIKPLKTQNSLNKIMNITTYNYQHLTHPDIQCIGVISNEVYDISPLATLDMHYTWQNSVDVSGNTNYDASGNPVKEDVYKKAINYNDLLIHNIGASQE